MRLKGKITGEGNTLLANKVSKIPKELEMKGIIDYLRYMKDMPIKKLREIVGPEGKVVVKGKGGDLTIVRSGEGILKAIRKGKTGNTIEVTTGEVADSVRRLSVS